MNRKTPQISLILNTYNRAERLKLCLPAYLRQTFSDFEMIIADDASEDHTPAIVEDFAKIASFPVRYVRHEKRGHHRAEILNRAILASTASFLVFTDADCLPMHDLLEVHWNAREEKRLLVGGRVMLSKNETRRVNAEKVAALDYERLLTPERRRKLTRLHLKNCFYIATRKKRRPHNYALNMAVERWALLAANGFDEVCQGWGDLDGELRERLRRIQVIPQMCLSPSRCFASLAPTPPYGERTEKP